MIKEVEEVTMAECFGCSAVCPTVTNIGEHMTADNMAVHSLYNNLKHLNYTIALVLQNS